MESFASQLKRTARNYRVLLLSWAALALGLALMGHLSWPLLPWQPLGMAAFVITVRLGTLLRFAGRVYSNEVPGRHVLLRLAPELRGKVDPAAQAERWDALVEAVTHRMGVQPALTPKILLFPSFAELEPVLGKDIPSAVLVPAQTIVVSVEALGFGVFSEELMRHHLARLFLSRWGTRRLPLQEEGLASWLQGTHGGEPVDLLALAAILDRPGLRLRELILAAAFEANRDCSYFLAGSFAGYLVQRYGWTVYREWYGQPSRQPFDAPFQSRFGKTLEAAEADWREALLARRPTLQPTLEAYRRRQAVKQAVQEERWAEALRELAALREAGQILAWDLKDEFHCYLELGNYAEAIRSLEARLCMEEVDPFSFGQAPIWLHLGTLYRDEGKPEAAKSAYLQCLQVPDAPHPNGHWCHEEAQHRLDRLAAFTSRRRDG